jgi:hypothetical protein
MERLRDIARTRSVEHGLLTQESAAALAALAEDPGGLVMACKRLVERHPTAGPLWTLCARVLTAGEPRTEAWRVLTEVDEDPSAGHLAEALPEGATITVVGWPELAARALPPRGDVEVLVVDALGEGSQLAHRLRRLDVASVEVPEGGTAAAVVASDVVVLEALATGPDAFLAPVGSRAAAAVARHAGVPVWLVAGACRALPGPLWDVVAARLPTGVDAVDAESELVPLDLVDVVVGPEGSATGTDLARRSDAPVAPELL